MKKPLLFAFSALSLALAAQANEPTAEAAVAVQAEASVPVTAPLLEPLPELDPAQWFDGKFGGTFGSKTVTAFPKTKRVAVAGFRVIFVNHTEARAVVRASYLPGRETTGACAKMIVDLEGVDAATLQAVTDAAYARFIEQIKATGREVIPLSEMQSFFDTVEKKPVPDAVDAANNRGWAFAPTGMPLWYSGEQPWAGGGFGFGNSTAFAKLSAALGAPITIAPFIVVDFAQMQSSGNRSGLLTKNAEVGAALSMSVREFGTRVVRAEEVRGMGVQKGDDGQLRMTGTLDTDIAFASLQEVEATKSDKLASAISFLGGLGNKKKTTMKAVTTNEAYRIASEAVLGQATGTFAKLFAQHPAP